MSVALARRNPFDVGYEHYEGQLRQGGTPDQIPVGWEVPGYGIAGLGGLDDSFKDIFQNLGDTIATSAAQLTGAYANVKLADLMTRLTAKVGISQPAPSTAGGPSVSPALRTSSTSVDSTVATGMADPSTIFGMKQSTFLIVIAAAVAVFVMLGSKKRKR